MDKTIEELVEEKKKIEQLIEEKKKIKLPIIISQLYDLSMTSNNGNKNVSFDSGEIRKYFNLSFNEFIDTIKNSNTFKIVSIRQPDYSGNRHLGGPDDPSPGSIVISKI